MLPRIVTLSLMTAFLAGTAAPAGRAAAAEPAKPSTRAILVAGSTGDPKGYYARDLRDWVDRFAQLLIQTGVPADHISALAETADPKPTPAVQESTLENIRAALDRAQKELRPDDQFVLFLSGIGSVTEPVGKLILPGPDLSARELAARLDAMPTQNIVVINCASGGAEFLAQYAHPGRIVVSASGIPGEGTQTYFAEFFLLAYETKKADKNQDGRITVLEAFNWAAAECVNWYHRQYYVSHTPNPDKTISYRVNVNGRESRRIFEKLYKGSNVEMVRNADTSDEDSEPVCGVFTEETAEHWYFRRETGEVASLEDRGEKKGALHWVDNKHVILEGKPGEEGATAARTVLGSPELLPPAK